MKQIDLSLLLGTAALVSAAIPALADTVAVTAPAINSTPWVDFVQPYVTMFAQAVVPVALGWLVLRLGQWLNVKISADTVNRLKNAAATEAGVLIAQSADNLRGRSIPVHSPEIAAAADRVIQRLPDTAKAAGVTPEVVQSFVAGELGKLQAAAPATVDPHALPQLKA